MSQNLMSSDRVVKICQHYLNNSKTFGLFRLPLIGFYGAGFEILVSKFSTLDLTRISKPGPKTIEITNVNRPNLLKCIRKNCPMVGIN